MNTFTIIQPKVEQKEEPITIIDLIPVGRENATYLIVKGFVLENRVNVLGEGRVFIFVD